MNEPFRQPSFIAIALSLPPILLYGALYQAMWGSIFPSPQTQAITSQIEGTTQIRIFRYTDRKQFTMPSVEAGRFITSLRVSQSKKSLLAADLKATFSFYRYSELRGTLWFVSDGSFRWLPSSPVNRSQALNTALHMRPGTKAYINRLVEVEL